MNLLTGRLRSRPAVLLLLESPFHMVNLYPETPIQKAPSTFGMSHETPSSRYHFYPGGGGVPDFSMRPQAHF